MLINGKGKSVFVKYIHVMLHIYIKTPQDEHFVRYIC